MKDRFVEITKWVMEKLENNFDKFIDKYVLLYYIYDPGLATPPPSPPCGVGNAGGGGGGGGGSSCGSSDMVMVCIVPPPLWCGWWWWQRRKYVYKYICVYI